MSKQDFIDEYKKIITRQGSAELLEWMSGTDFFTAPASSKFHSAYEGGLCDHSLNVYRVMISRFNDNRPDESMAICGLLHDLCKAEFYKPSFRNVKDDATGKWEKVPYYTIEDRFPYGHGEKSVIMLQQHLRLTPEEIYCIRYHMGAFTDKDEWNYYARAVKKYPNVLWTHTADMIASNILDT